MSASSSAYLNPIYLNTQENITDIPMAVPMNENTIWIIHENGTITQEPTLEIDQLVTQTCSSEESQHASIRDLYSIQNLSVVGDENLNPNIKPVESLNIIEQIQNKNPVSIVNLDEKAIDSPSPKKGIFINF